MKKENSKNAKANGTEINRMNKGLGDGEKAAAIKPQRETFEYVCFIICLCICTSLHLFHCLFLLYVYVHSLSSSFCLLGFLHCLIPFSHCGKCVRCV